MSMVTPVANQINNFDATKDQVFSFSVNGGDLITKNRLVIRLQSNNSTVYDHTTETYLMKQTVPANTLTNGTYYNFYFITYNAKGEASTQSNIIQFRCLSTPTLEFTNIPTNNKIESTAYTFYTSYNQAQGDLLSSLKFNLYDASNNLIAESDFYSGSSTLPTVTSHSFSGFENNTSYKIEAVAISVSGMEISTPLVTFLVSFYHPSFYSLLDLENDCELGCIKLKSNLIIANGVADNYEYVQNGSKKMLDIHTREGVVNFNEGFNINSDFTLMTRISISRLDNYFLILGDVDNGYSFILERGLYNGTPKDRVKVIGKNCSINKVEINSNVVDVLGSNSQYGIWFQKKGNDYTLKISALQSIADIMQWSNSNVNYETITSLLWDGTNYSNLSSSSNIEDMSQVFPINDIRFNSVYCDYLYVTSDTSITETYEDFDWNYYTILKCDFNENLMGGNANIIINTVQNVKIKRRKANTFNWITLKEIEIDGKIENFNISYIDYLVPNNTKVEYALVPIIENNVEGDYISATILSKFYNFIVTNNESVFQFKNAQFGNTVANTTVGTYTPLSGKYPILQQNSQLNYKSGSFSATLLGYHFNQTHKLDREEILQQSKDLCNFLNDLSAKVIKDPNGDIKIVRFTGSPSLAYSTNWGNGLISVSANWIEQGSALKQSDLYTNGLISAKQ